MGLGRAADVASTPSPPRRLAGPLNAQRQTRWWRAIWNRASRPLDEAGEFGGTVAPVAARLRTDKPDVADAILHEAERTAAEPFERAAGAERRAKPLQAAIAIAASFGIAAGALLLDRNKVGSNEWRGAFAVLSLCFVCCLVGSGFRAVGTVYRVHGWSYPDGDEIFERAHMIRPTRR